jgi:type III pantothenate kinase
LGKFIPVIRLVIDAGNSFYKLALFSGVELIAVSKTKKDLRGELEALINNHGNIQSAIWSSVRENDGEIEAELDRAQIAKKVTVRSGLLLPVKVTYKTPETLGNDRLANVCAAITQFPETNVLVVDMGTCIKYDLVTSDSCYPGGSIAPGLQMRYKALSRFTGKLPYIKNPPDLFPELTGQSTEGSIRSGVENGIAAELNGICQQYHDAYNNLKIIMTGGDHPRFADKLKSGIFVAPNLTLEGLKVILDHNDL